MNRTAPRTRRSTLLPLLILLGGDGDSPQEGESDVAAIASRDPIRSAIARRRLFGTRAVAALSSGLRLAAPNEMAARIDLLRELDPQAVGLALPDRPEHLENPGLATAVAAWIGASGETPEGWGRDLIATLLAAPDPAPASALFARLAETTEPVRARFATRHAAPLQQLFESADPLLRRHALDLLALRDDDAAATFALAQLPSWPASEQRRFLAACADRLPAWRPERLQQLARVAAEALDATADEQRLLALRLRIECAAAPAATPLDDATLLELLASASRVTTGPREQAEAALGKLGPASALRLLPLVAELPEESSPDEALALFLRLRGVAGVDELIHYVAEPKTRPELAEAALGVLTRVRCEAVARRLVDAEIARPELARPLAQCALGLPQCAARDQLLLQALEQLHGEALLASFEALTTQHRADHFGPLLAVLDREHDPRRHATLLLHFAAGFGATLPDRVLTRVAGGLASHEASERAAALAVFPLLALDEKQRDDVIAAIADHVADFDPAALATSLSQVGGDAVERLFEQLARNFPPAAGADSSAEPLRLLCLRCATLHGEPTRKLLIDSLGDVRAGVREAALRALIRRADPTTFEALPRLLPGLESAMRPPLLSELGALHDSPDYAGFVRRLFEQADEETSRLALLELAEPRLREVVLPIALGLLEQSTDDDERGAAATALGEIGGAAAIAELERRADRNPVSGSASETRVALLALAKAAPERAAPRLARALLGRETTRGLEQLTREARGLPLGAVECDLPLVDALAAIGGPALAALETAWRDAGAEAWLCDERVFSAMAARLDEVGGTEPLAEWFDARVLLLWPASSAADLRALLPPGARREPFDPADLAAIVRARVRSRLSAPEDEEFFGARDLLRGITPERTLAAAARGERATIDSAADDHRFSRIREELETSDR